MSRSIKSIITLNNGVKIPQLGFGTALIGAGHPSKIDEGFNIEVILKAITAGYRHFDTASNYCNEAAVGKAIRQSGIPREEFFITTKLWTEDMRQNRQREAFNESLQRLKMNYVDLFLIHWAVPEKYVRSWVILENIYNDGLARSIGVSNFTPTHLENIRLVSSIVPVINQCECHPQHANFELKEYCRKQKIAFEAFAPLGQGIYKDNQRLLYIANQYGKSISQVIIRWHLQNDTILFPMSTSEAHIQENANVYDFELDSEDMRIINEMDCNRSLLSGTPDCFDWY
jgi:methylglyoxal/glyoxal reductase